MAVIIKEQLKTLSDDTFFDNDQGEIDPSEHRAFNNELIDALVTGATLNGNDVPVNNGKLEITFNDITAATFIVDSDEALAAWANNAEGNDYSHVLIKKGTWSSSKEVNLTTAGTKVVVGQAGSLLNFTSQYGLRYDAVPTTSDYWMLGVNVTVTAAAGTGAGFQSCTNLTNCTGIATNTNSSSSGIGFGQCNNLMNCTGSGIGTVLSFGFVACRIMMFCKPGSPVSSNGMYVSCYMNASGTTNSVSDTAAGGWNRS
jgi:hypothetical protein